MNKKNDGNLEILLINFMTIIIIVSSVFVLYTMLKDIDDKITELNNKSIVRDVSQPIALSGGDLEIGALSSGLNNLSVGIETINETLEKHTETLDTHTQAFSQLILSNNS